MRRRVLGMLAAAALGLTAVVGVAPAATADVPLPPVNPLGAEYVAFGDSAAAGTGNLPYVDVDCKRSKKAYPALVAASFDSAASYACSGATTQELWAVDPTTGPSGQVWDAYMAGDLGASTEFVTVTAGINDLHWQEVLLACSDLGTPAECQAAQDGLPAAMAAMGSSLYEVLSAIAYFAPAAYVTVTGYPQLFGAFSGSCSIGAYAGTPVQVSDAQAFVANLAIYNPSGAPDSVNEVVAAAAAGAGAFYNPYVDGDFAGHRLCDTGDRWISGFVSGKKTADRSLHPNTEGQQAYFWAIWGH